MDQIKIGLFLRSLREERGLTQAALAERVGVSNRSVSRWETGRNLPDLSILMQLTEFFGVTLSEMVNGERESGEKSMDEKEKKALRLALAYYEGQTKREVKALNGMLIGGALACVASLLYPDGEIAGLLRNFTNGIIVTAPIALTAYLCDRRSLMPAVYYYQESPIRAKTIRGHKDVCGWLRLHRDGFRFEASGQLGFWKEDLDVAFADVREIRDGKSLGIIPNRLILQLNDGERIKIVLERKDIPRVKKAFAEYRQSA